MKLRIPLTRCDTAFRVCYVIQEDSTLQKEGCVLLPRQPRTTRSWCGLLLQNRVAFATLPDSSAVRGWQYLLTAEDDFLEEEYVIFSVDVHLRDHEDILEDEFSEIG